MVDETRIHPVMGDFTFTRRNSINGTILRAKTGDDIVRMSVMMIDDNILGTKRHLEDENCICEMRVRSKVFFDGAKEQRSRRRIGVLDECECV